MTKIIKLLNRKKRYVLGAIITALLLISFVTVFVLNSSGYCLSQFEKKSDYQKIREGVKYVMFNYPYNFLGLNGNYLDKIRPKKRSDLKLIRDAVSLKNIVEYTSVDDFLKSNPNCCEFSSSFDTDSGVPEGLVRWFGIISGYVFVNYKINYFNGSSIDSIPVEVALPISNCGRVHIWWDFLKTDGFSSIYFLITKE